MPANGLLMIAPVRTGQEKDLADALNLFGNDIQGKRILPTAARIDFAASSAIHFARCALLDDPDRGGDRKRLLFATDFDGSLSEHLREIYRLTHHPESIWGRLEGFAGEEQFADFVVARLVPPGAYYMAFRNIPLPAMREAIAFHAAFQTRLAEPNLPGTFPFLADVLHIGRSLRTAWEFVSRPFVIGFRALRAAAEVLVLMARLGVGNVLRAALRINATLNRVWWIRPLNTLLFNRPIKRAHSFSQADPRARIPTAPPGCPPEDAVLQNQLTLVTDVAESGRAELKAVLALIDLYGRQLSSPGVLVGISTIHTVRWALIDDDRRLLMVSNYDNTWENYIDEFAEMILSGLDALWRSAPDYPAAGAQDVAALKQFLRRHQAPANAFYSALPDTSVLNLREHLAFRSWFQPVLQQLRVVPAKPNV